jgi:hypothetical protein
MCSYAGEEEEEERQVTSASIILRRALAIDASTPTRSNSISCDFRTVFQGSDFLRTLELARTRLLPAIVTLSTVADTSFVCYKGIGCTIRSRVGKPHRQEQLYQLLISSSGLLRNYPARHLLCPLKWHAIDRWIPCHIMHCWRSQ